MRSEQSSGRRFSLRPSDKVLLGITGVLIVLIIALSILQRCGFTPIRSTILFYLPLLALFVLVGWGVYALVRRISNRTVKMLVSIVLGMLLVLALLLVFTYVSYIAYYAVPQRYTTIVSPSGAHTLVVMRALDADETRMEARKAARLAADPDGDPESTMEDWGFIYRAYPQALRMFYRSNADVEGEVMLAIDAAAEGNAGTEESSQTEQAKSIPHGTLMVEWLEGESGAHFFVENPGVAEGGDCTVRF